MTIRKWNKRLDKTIMGGSKKQDTEIIKHSNSDDETLEDVEEKLQYYQDMHYFHVFIVPNYAEPEDLLKDTIERIASHR